MTTEGVRPHGLTEMQTALEEQGELEVANALSDLRTQIETCLRTVQEPSEILDQIHLAIQALTSLSPELASAVVLAAVDDILKKVLTASFVEDLNSRRKTAAARNTELPTTAYGLRLQALLTARGVSVEQLLERIVYEVTPSGVKSFQRFLEGKGCQDYRRRQDQLRFALSQKCYAYVFEGADMPLNGPVLNDRSHYETVKHVWEAKPEAERNFGFRLQMLVLLSRWSESTFGENIKGLTNTSYIGAWIRNNQDWNGLHASSKELLMSSFTETACEFLSGNSADLIPEGSSFFRKR